MLAEQLINGLTLGSIYALIAIGYTLVFGVLDIVNMAHGEIFMFGAFAGMLMSMKLGVPLPVAFLGAAALTAVMGYMLELLALRPLRRPSGNAEGNPGLSTLISTIGVAIILENLSLKLFGAENQPFRTSFGNVRFTIGPINVYVIQVVILLTSGVLICGLALWLKRSRSGRALRATAESPDTAALMGVDTKKIITTTVVTASAMAGTAGVLVAISFSNVGTRMGVSMGLKGLAIILFGGMGSVNGALVGGIILGLAETLVVAYGDSGYRDAIAFVIIIGVLLLKPKGLFGQSAS